MKTSAMKRRRVIAFLGGLMVALLLAIGFNINSAPVQAQSATLLVGAAASLQDVLTELDPIFEAANPGVTVNYNFAASGVLQQQIEQGAPVDVFFSAAAKQMDALQEKGLIATETRLNLLTNQLVLIVPKNSTLGLTSFRQLTNASVKKISIGEPRSVPVGQYAIELLTNLGILEAVRPKLVYGNSVRNVLSVVESGNADAGIVYATDAKISAQVTQVATAPDRLHSPITYPVAVVKASRNADAAKLYAQFLAGDRAKETFSKYGFGIAP
jgi:molybdate transport system substrate-binding protein